ncbi:MAG TPA: M20/M25/M40 family metallo-hydrolase [Vicinamibacterales bacterium]|nr:M20/M25/M40 family metallo-hydrolase [Vicinamibacterales bacterium]
MKNSLFGLSVAMVLAAGLLSARQDRIDFGVIEKIRAEGTERSKAVELFDYLTTNIGPRLTNSPAHRRSIEWAQQTLKSWGMSEVHTEPFEFGRGWTLTKLSIEMVEPRYMALIGYTRGWSPATPGRIVATPVWMPGLEADAMKAQAGKLRGAILFTSPLQEYAIRADRPAASGDLKPPSPQPSRPPQLNAERLAALKTEGVAVTIEPNIGEHGTVFVTGRDMGADAVPSIVLASEHYNLVARMLQQKLPVKLAVEIQAAFNEEDKNALNVIWEIPGTDNALKDEIVMAGAHLDSWHTATGATDNADGSATIMEAMRILKTLNIRPRRTIRGALWAGEEQGLLGSRAWVARHLAGDKNKAARDKFSVYFNLDNGYPPITGFYMEGNEPARAIMAEWLKPVAALGAIMPAPGHIGATDHLSFLDVGVPGFQAVQEYVNYDVRTHHTNVDFAERVDPKALKQASTVMAVVLYQAAMREGTFPKPAPKPAKSDK